MADPLSVTASVLGVAAFGQQVIQAVLKIKQLSKELKNAPTELQELLDEIEVVCLILAQLSANEARELDMSMDEDVLTRSLHLCQRAAQRILSLATELQERMRKRKYLTAVKMLISKRDIDTMIGRLTRSKADLHLAHSMFTMAKQKQQHDLVIEKLRIFEEQHKLSGTAQGVNQESRGRKGSKSLATSGQVWKVRVKLPTWLCTYACDLLFERASGSWGMMLKSYQTLPKYGTAWKMCETGNIDGIIGMLQDRQLSIHDQFYEPGESIETLYNVAIRYQQTSLARHLLDHGADAVWLPYWAESYEFGGPRKYGLYIQNAESIADSLACARDHARLLQEQHSGNSEIFDQIVDVFAETESSWNTRERLFVLDCQSEHRDVVASLWDMIMRPKFDDNTLSLKSLWNEADLLHVISKQCAHDIFSFSITGDRKMTDAISRWFALLSRACICGAEVHRRDVWGWTPLMWFSWLLPDDRHDKEVLHWFSTLAKAGIDLNEYVATERAIVGSSNHPKRSDPYRHWIGITGFEHGPEPSDWKLWYRNTTDGYAGEFWDMVEHPERAVPGAWVEEEMPQVWSMSGQAA